MSVPRALIVFAALNGAMAVALGAFAAHGAGPAVKTLLTTGAQYQAIHALFALLATILAPRLPLARMAGWIGAMGGLIFALSLAFVGVFGLRFMGAVAPIGGTLMIAGWILLAFAAMRSETVGDR